MSDAERLVETVTLGQAKALICALAVERSLLLLSPPGVGKSDVVRQAATEAGLECRSLLGTQIAPEDVSGVPRIVGERSVFCPPRVLLPEEPRPFCLFLDELPACTPDIQKAFYALLLERRLGEHKLPPGSWVVAAGNRAEDRALVRTVSSALVNRVLILNVRVDHRQWLDWAAVHDIRADIRTLIDDHPHVLMGDLPKQPAPFSTPRAWAALSQAIDLAERGGILDSATVEALAYGRVSPNHAPLFVWYYHLMRRMPAPVRARGVCNLLNSSVCELNLSAHLTDTLLRHNATTISALLETRADDLIAAAKLDSLQVADIEEALARYGLELGMRHRI